MKYATCEALFDAINKGTLDADLLTMYLDGGEVIVNNGTGETVYQGYEREVLVELFLVFLGIKHEEI